MIIVIQFDFTCLYFNMKLLLLLKKLETSKESVFKKIKNIRTNHGTKFLMLSFMNFKGILHQHSCVEISQQNFVV